MSGDSETVEDTKKGLLAEVTDDSCTLEFIEIVPLDRPSEDLQEMKQESADEDDNGDSHYYARQELINEYNTGSPSFPVQVSSTLLFSSISVKPHMQCEKRNIVHVFKLK